MRVIGFFATIKTERFYGEVLEKLIDMSDDDLLNRGIENMPENMRQSWLLTLNGTFYASGQNSIWQITDGSFSNALSATSPPCASTPTATFTRLLFS